GAGAGAAAGRRCDFLFLDFFIFLLDDDLDIIPRVALVGKEEVGLEVGPLVGREVGGTGTVQDSVFSLNEVVVRASSTEHTKFALAFVASILPLLKGSEGLSLQIDVAAVQALLSTTTHPALMSPNPAHAYVASVHAPSPSVIEVVFAKPTLLHTPRPIGSLQAPSPIETLEAAENRIVLHAVSP
ncbi:MAG: hypothetical protein AAGJ35_09890, partial [Myxococcota bacterium]